MPLKYENLTPQTRQVMLDTLNEDITQRLAYLSPRLNNVGKAQYVNLLKEAITNGSDQTLANSLQGKFSLEEIKRTPSGGMTKAKVPYTANVTLAEGEFNRYYIRALCKIAVDNGTNKVQVYRAKDTSFHRPESDRLIGEFLDAKLVMDDLKRNIGREPSLGVPNPNSGLSVKLLLKKEDNNG